MNEKKLIRRIGIYALAAIAIWLVPAAPVFGGTATKTFDFGAGGDNPTSRGHARTFPVPQGVAAAVRVTYRTAGETPVPIVVEIEDGDGRLAATRELAAEKSARQLIVDIAAAENTARGCERGWQVRVRSRDGQIPAGRVFGEITLSFINPAAARVWLEGPAFDLAKNARATRQLGAAETFRHPGVINVRASWTHNPLVQAQALKFELVRPDGSVAASLVGYGTNSGSQPKIDFDYRVLAADTRRNGVWQLRVTNDTEQEMREISPSASFTRQCFE
jgi:hypothetical protein